jgi:spore coat protein YsxE
MGPIEWQMKHLLYEYDLFSYRIDEHGKDKWRVGTDRGIFLLEKTYEHTAQLYFVAYWLHYLFHRGVRSVIPFCVTKYGEPYIATSEGIYLLYPWIEEANTVQSMPNWEAKVLKEVGRIHRISEQAKEKWRGYAPISLKQIKQRWENGITQIAVVETKQKEWRNELERNIIEDAGYVKQFAEWALQELNKATEKIEEKGLVRVLCHGRIHRRNIIVDTDHHFYFTRFERANFDTPVRDLAIFFRRYAPYYQWSIQKGREWLAAYEAERLLTEEERQLLSCYVLFPEKLVQIARNYMLDPNKKQKQQAGHYIQTWQKHLQLLPKMRRFAFAIARK